MTMLRPDLAIIADHVAAASRVLDIFEALSASPRGLSFTALQQALKTGAVDSIWQMPTRDADEVKKTSTLELYQPEFNAIVQMLKT